MIHFKKYGNPVTFVAKWAENLKIICFVYVDTLLFYSTAWILVPLTHDLHYLSKFEEHWISSIFTCGYTHRPVCVDTAARKESWFCDQTVMNNMRLKFVSQLFLSWYIKIFLSSELHEFGYSAKSARFPLLGGVGRSISSGQLIESKQQLMSV